VTVAGPETTTAEPTGRRARNRLARHRQLMSAASEIVSTHGLDGLTMQLVADRVECAVGTIYTYFDSKSSLLAALQIEAIETLGGTFRRSREVWDSELTADGVDDATASLVRLVAFGHLFTNGPRLHPREFELLQMLLSTPRRTTTDADARQVIPAALTLFNEFRLLLEHAVEVGAMEPDRTAGPLGDFSLDRTVRWTGALNGALLVSNLASVASVDIEPTEDLSTVPALRSELLDGRSLALRVGHDFLVAWGTNPERLAAAVDYVDQLNRKGQLVPAEVLERSAQDLDAAAAAPSAVTSG
jgi:AcrR family transcriptional regulator